MAMILVSRERPASMRDRPWPFIVIWGMASNQVQMLLAAGDPDAQPVAWRNILIQFYRYFSGFLKGADAESIVVDASAAIEIRPVGDHFLRDRAQPAGWYDRAGEKRIAVERILQRNRCTGSGSGLGEVATAFECRWYRNQARLRCNLARLFDGDKEERLVAPVEEFGIHWSIECAAELMQAQVAFRCREEVSSIENGVACVLKRRPMQQIGTALHRQCDDAAGDLPIFRRIVIRHDAELLDRFQVRRIDAEHIAAGDVTSLHAIDQQVDVVRPCSVCRHARAPNLLRPRRDAGR